MTLSATAFAASAHVEVLPEQIIMLQTQVTPEVLLETTIYKPDGPGPFPLVIMNHGSSGFPRQQTRDRPLSVARYFLERGYMVAAPMREGFSKSTGTIDNHGCDVQSDALGHAQDVRAALLKLEMRPDVDAKHVLLMGQSFGGMAVLAAGSLRLPGVRGIVNFSGVISIPSCWNWPVSLIDASAHFGKTSRTPSLWFYGSNDSFIPQGAARSMASAYDRAGGYVRLITYPDFKKDGHFLLYDADGRDIWEKPLTDFLAQVGMPYEVTHPEYTFLPLLAIPPASNFAAIDDIDKLPLVGEQGRQRYRDFLQKEGPRAFAISGDGASAMWYGGRDNSRSALASCATYAIKPCYLYVVDSTVVWDPKNVSQQPLAWHRLATSPNSIWLQVIFIAVMFIFLIINVVRAINRLRFAFDDDRRIATNGPATTTAHRAFSKKNTLMRITKTGIVWGLTLMVIPVAIFIDDPMSPWLQPLRSNGQLFITALGVCYWLGGLLLKKLGYPIGHIITTAPDTAESLTAKAVSNGYQPP